MHLFNQKYHFLFLSVLLIASCNTEYVDEKPQLTSLPPNILNYVGTPSAPMDRSSLMFSDQGAWFAFGFPSAENMSLGFSGPFLMTQGFGEWSSEMLTQLTLVDAGTQKEIIIEDFSVSQLSYNSHLQQTFENENMKIVQSLFYASGHSAITTTEITNLSDKTKTLQPNWKGAAFSTGLKMSKQAGAIILTTDRSNAKGIIQTFGNQVENMSNTDSTYNISSKAIDIKPNETKMLTASQTFIFPEYDEVQEQKVLEVQAKDPLQFLEKRVSKKLKQLNDLSNKLDESWQDSIYLDLMAKAVLTLQSNTRIPAGELKHAGLFPSYHYKWFLGFWAWDSWKHAVALAHYDPELAKNQIRAMYDFQLDNGFIVDCVYRDTSIEKHNFRNTKPPLSAWSTWKVYEQEGDSEFIKEMYPKIVRQHNWWYTYRDYDNDGICEYGSTDGTLVAAKWESGMDNAVRFDSSQMVKSAETVFSLNQESVDLNAYLYAEKMYLSEMAKLMGQIDDAKLFESEANELKLQIQNQFYDESSGWFYDTSIDGEKFIEVLGCEGWIPLWAKVATAEQAEAVKNNMIDPQHFNTKVPFQTLSASHPSFKPDGGYWRGPNWLDQAYFGVMALHNYGYHREAKDATYKLMHNAEGVLGKGVSIRENYHPLTGAGMESKNFSWSAAHYLLLLINE